MQSLGTGTQSASGLSAAFSTRPDSYLRKPGIGTDRQLGGGEKGIYKTSEIGPFDDPISRFEDNENDINIDIDIDIEFDDLNIDIGNIDGARVAADSLSRIGTKAQSNQLNAMGIGSYAGAAGPIGNSVSEGITIENLLEGFIREVLLENSSARSMSFSPYATLNKGPGSYQSSLNMTSKNNQRMKPFKQRSVTAQDMNSAGGGIQRRYDRRPRTGDPKAWVGGRAGDLMRNAMHPEDDESHVISQSEKREHGIGLSTWEMFQQTQTDKDEQFVKRRRNEENALKSKK